MNPSESASPQDAGALRFEDALARLEAVVHRLEEGELSLDESLAEYKQGVGLLRWCHKELADAEREIELLLAVDEAGRPVTREFVECDGDSPESPPPKRQKKTRPRSAPQSSRTPDSAGGVRSTPQFLGEC